MQQSQNHTLINRRTKITKTPREYGIVSYLGSSKNPIAIARVLLGMYVGFGKNEGKTIKEILNSPKLSSKNDLLKNVKVEQVISPLYAVTLSDIYGIDNEMNPDREIFGADGEWNDTRCHTKFTINKAGQWATLAEFRGGLDGFNIGYILSSFMEIKSEHTKTVSQILRYYYSKDGLTSESALCFRGRNIKTIEDDIKTEALSYLNIWNSYYHSGQFSDEQVKYYIDGLFEKFVKTLMIASTLSEGKLTLKQKVFSNQTVFSKMKETIVVKSRAP